MFRELAPIALATAVLIVLSTAWAFAQPRCFHPYHWLQLMQRLGESVHEVQDRETPQGSPFKVFLWVNKETGSYTLSAVGPDGLTCSMGGAFDGYEGQTISDFLLGPAY